VLALTVLVVIGKPVDHAAAGDDLPVAARTVLVVAGPDESASELVVAAARDLAPELPIIARASTRDG